MITIVIADDEKLIRAGISKILRDNIDVEMEIFEAKNGQEALELCVEKKPNVLITDIRMPIMDGVELMEKVAALKEKTAIIVLSGYDDFKYAKAAIQSGALSYILKPLDKKELVSTVLQVISEVKNQTQQRNEKVLKSIIDEGRVSGEVDVAGWNFPNGLYCLSVMGPNCRKEIERAFVDVEYYTLESKKDYLCVVIAKEGKLVLDTDISLNSLIIGVSMAFDNVTSVRIMKKQAFIAMLEYYFNPRDHIFYFVDDSDINDFTRQDDQYERCITRLMVAESEDIQKEVDQLFDFSDYKNSEKAVRLAYLYEKITANLSTRYSFYSSNDSYLLLKSIMIDNIWQFKNLDDWKHMVMDYMLYLRELLHQNTVEYPYIEEALDYIHSNYSKNINMAMVANQVDTNYTWFSEKFKEHTGVNFNEYLKKLRIDEACKLLEKGCYKIYEVAERSGFGDAKYFMKTFKESTGVSPGEWKRIHEKS